MINRSKERGIIREAILRVVNANEDIPNIIKAGFMCSHIYQMRLIKDAMSGAVILTGKITFDKGDIEVIYEPKVWLGDNILKDIPPWDMREVWKATIEEWIKKESDK